MIKKPLFTLVIEPALIRGGSTLALLEAKPVKPYQYFYGQCPTFQEESGYLIKWVCTIVHVPTQISLCIPGLDVMSNSYVYFCTKLGLLKGNVSNFFALRKRSSI